MVARQFVAGKIAQQPLGYLVEAAAREIARQQLASWVVARQLVEAAAGAKGQPVEPAAFARQLVEPAVGVSTEVAPSTKD